MIRRSFMNALISVLPVPLFLRNEKKLVETVIVHGNTNFYVQNNNKCYFIYSNK
jgi:hypothetical protein